MFLTHTARREAERAAAVEMGFGPGDGIEVLTHDETVIASGEMGDDAICRIPVENLGDYILGLARSKRTGQTIPLSDWMRRDDYPPGSYYEVRFNVSFGDY